LVKGGSSTTSCWANSTMSRMLAVDLVAVVVGAEEARQPLADTSAIDRGILAAARGGDGVRAQVRGEDLQAEIAGSGSLFHRLG
jgi:hypothetical protein